MKKKSSSLVIIGNEAGDPRKQAEENPYDPSKPSIGFKSQKLRKVGSSSTPYTGGGNTFSQAPLMYDYRTSTPDKFYYPKSRATANSVWRDIYRRDATVAIATDMYAELPWSKFGIEGIDDNKIRSVYESMFDDLNLVPKFPEYTRDYLIHGEQILHALFNSTKGYWERIISHSPDYVEVKGIGLALDQPLIWLHPTPEIKELLKSTDPRLKKYIKSLPPSVVSAFSANEPILMDPLNTTYLARKNLSTETRGTSMYTRLFRVTVYEDFVVNASLAVAQRNAAPIRLFKLGKEDWLPTDDDIQEFANLLSITESDPMAAIITHDGVEVEYVGVSDKSLLISKEWDFIERVKLLAMGVSRAFLVGETSFAAAVAGLQALLERLSAMRLKFEEEWMINKLCKPIAKINGFYEISKSELDHRIRVKKPEERKLIIPKIKWYKSLDPTQEVSLLNVWSQLKDKGIISDRTYTAGAGIDLEVERRNLLEEKEYAEKMEKDLGEDPSEEAEEDGFSPSLRPAPEPEPASLRNPYNRHKADSALKEVEVAFEDSEDLSMNEIHGLLKGGKDAAKVIKSVKLRKSKKTKLAKKDLLSGIKTGV